VRSGRRLIHVSNLYRIPAQERLGERLCAAAGMDRVFFANSGAEANEAAIKLARLHAHRKRRRRPEVLVMENSFHGRTLATLTATGNRKAQAGFEPLVQGFVRVPYDDLDAVETAAANRPNIVAVLVEPIQGEGGIVVPADGYLAAARPLRPPRLAADAGRDPDRHGPHRAMFAHQHAGDPPGRHDPGEGPRQRRAHRRLPRARRRGRGARPRLPRLHLRRQPARLPRRHRGAGRWQPRTHARARRRRSGQRMLDGFRRAFDGVDGVNQVRGRGLMIGIELDRPCAELVAAPSTTAC
jgi:acetylornithine/N-succinyldiaminopimelate aminotransferase